MSNPFHPIKALILDFGGVLMRTENHAPRERLARRLGLSREELTSIVFDTEESRLAEVGRLSSEERWRRVTSRLGLNSPQERESFSRQFFGGETLDSELVDYVRRLRGRFKTALLSNASDSLDGFVRHKLGLDDTFDVIIISALVGVSKPDPAIYRLALDRLQVAPHEAVFVDDRQVNVEGAASLGIHGIHFATREALLEELNALLDIEGPAQGGND